MSTMNVVKTFAAAALLTLSVVVPLSAQDKAPVRVYLKPPVEAGGLVLGDAAKDRLDSTADLRKSLLRHDKDIVLVDDPTQAQLTIEVLSRKMVKTGDMERSTLPGVAATEGEAESLTVRLTTASGQSGEMTETLKGQWTSWKMAAGILSGKIQKWIKANRDKL